LKKNSHPKVLSLKWFRKHKKTAANTCKYLPFNKRKINSTTCPGSYRCIGDLSGLQFS